MSIDKNKSSYVYMSEKAMSHKPVASPIQFKLIQKFDYVGRFVSLIFKVNRKDLVQQVISGNRWLVQGQPQNKL